MATIQARARRIGRSSLPERIQITNELLQEVARRALAGEEALRIAASLRLSRQYEDSLAEYDPKLAERILSHIAMGINPFYLEREDWFPGMPTFAMWLVQEPEFNKHFKQALQMFGYMAAFKALQAAEEPNIENDKNFEMKRRVLTDTLIWFAGKANIKQFGAHVAISAEITDHTKVSAQQTERGRIAFEELMATRRQRYITDASFDDTTERDKVQAETEAEP